MSSHVIFACVRTEESNKEGSGSPKEGERSRHKVCCSLISDLENMNLWLCVLFFLDKLLELLHEICFFVVVFLRF